MITMKRQIFSLFAIVLSFASPLASASKAPAISSKAAIVMDIDSKEILYQKNAYEVQYPASITKVPTALYAIRKGSKLLSTYATADKDTMGSITKKFSRDNKFRYPPHWLVLGGTHIKIHDGEKMRLNDLMYGMLLESGNDASNVIAKHISGSVQAFMSELNDYVKKIGCKNTHFKNPHGQHFPKHVTTAYDMAIITCEAVREPTLVEIMKTYSYTIPATNKWKARKLVNHNKLISKKSVYYYPYALGGKTGYHDQSKNTFVAAAKKGGRTLVVVLMQCPNKNKKYEDAIALFEHGFKRSK